MSDLSDYSAGQSLAGCFSCHFGRLLPADQFEHEPDCPSLTKCTAVCTSIDVQRGTLDVSAKDLP